ncbi:DUF1761 domain-containing protein [Actinomadura rubrisoli]|uniref:DUF1761 domain-containing protein n=2 Tax=Actinomadura rubrisoli TaxID=2530368 RepID=A0A4R4ZWS7_9ACTN|nr:DUF1761 domain-containing protein [Actinomadura rubrisoli]
MSALTDPGDVNYLAVTVAAVTRLPIAGLWHSPIMFGTYWERDVGLSAEQMRRRRLPALFVLAFATSLAGAFVLALLLGRDAGLAAGALAGLLTGLCVAAGALLSSMAFEARPPRLIAIDVGFHTVVFTVIGAVIGAW